MRPYLRVANVYEARIDTADVLEMNFTPAEYERYRLEAGDVLLNEGQSKELVGRPAIYRGEVAGACFQNTLVRFKPGAGTTSEFALMVFRNYLHDGTFQGIASWTTNIAHLGAGRFAELDYPVPPLPEQVRITTELDSYLSRLDAAVAGLKRVQANLKRYRASVLKAAVEGRLVPTEAELARAEGRDYEPASVLLERILKERRRRWEEAELAKLKAKGKPPKDDKWKAKYKEPEAPDTSGLPELPEGWCWARLEVLCSHIVDCLHGTPTYTPQGYPAIRTADVVVGRLLLESARRVSEDSYAKRIVRLEPAEDDVLYTREGERFGLAALVPPKVRLCLAQRMMQFRLDPSVVPQYFMWLLNSPWVYALAKRDVGGSTSPHVNIGSIRAFLVPLPPRAEQARIASEAARLVSIADETDESVQHDVSRVRTLRQSILKWAFEGKLVDQDPADEPASVLLDRIRAEREVADTSKSRRNSPRKRGKTNRASLSSRSTKGAEP